MVEEQLLPLAADLLGGGETLFAVDLLGCKVMIWGEMNNYDGKKEEDEEGGEK